MRTLSIYRSYNFVRKDPVIDKVRTIVAKEGLKHSEIHMLSGVTPTTLHNWFHGKTRRPQYATIAAVTRGLGYAMTFKKAKNYNFEAEIKSATEEFLANAKRKERREQREKLNGSSHRSNGVRRSHKNGAHRNGASAHP